MRTIDADALKEVIKANHYLLSAKNNSTDYGMFTTGIMQAIDNAPAVDIQEADCVNCDYLKFSETFIDGIVEAMKKNDIKTVEQLSEMLIRL